MKKYINKLLYASLGIIFLSACSEDIDTVAEIKDNAGVLIEVSSQSSGQFLGSPEADVEIPEASVEISDASVSLTITKVAGDIENSNIDRLEVVKSVRGSEPVVIGETTTLPYTVNLDGIDDFLEGTGISPEDLRIGDALTLRVRAVMNNGDHYYYDNSMGRFNLALNCSYDLSGTYTVTNTICGGGSSGTIPSVTISQNSDGTWYAATADGGLLQFCSSNTTLQNMGSFAVVCGGVVDASNTNGGPAYCGSNGIGCITGGSWNQETGVLVLEHTNDFFTWADGTYTSTYVRQ